MMPSASSRCIRFQHGVDDKPTRLPISATESEALSCSRLRILRSIASMEAAPAERDRTDSPQLSGISAVHRKVFPGNHQLDRGPTGVIMKENRPSFPPTRG